MAPQDQRLAGDPGRAVDPPGLRGTHRTTVAGCVRRGPDDNAAVQHPCDPGCGSVGDRRLRPLPRRVDAVVSLTPLGAGQKPVPRWPTENQIAVWLLDSEDPDDNPNLEFVAEQTVDLLSSLRSEGHTVYLHCVDGGTQWRSSPRCTERGSRTCQPPGLAADPGGPAARG